jgi:uncharacterized protein YggE
MYSAGKQRSGIAAVRYSSACRRWLKQEFYMNFSKKTICAKTMKVLFLGMVSVLFLANTVTVQAQAQNSAKGKPARTLTLSATGSVDTRPDMVGISTGIVTEAVKAREALDDSNEVVSQMLKSLKARGIDEKDIATTQFSVQPRYQQYKNGRTPRIIGYRVVNSVNVTVRKLDELGPTLDRLVTFGSNRIGQIRFALSDPDKAADEARQEAMRKVLAKAELYAQAAGVRLGPITSIREQTSQVMPRPTAFRSSRMAKSSVPIAPGQHKTNITVHVSWSLIE